MTGPQSLCALRRPKADHCQQVCGSLPAGLLKAHLVPLTKRNSMPSNSKLLRCHQRHEIPCAHELVACSILLSQHLNRPHTYATCRHVERLTWCMAWALRLR